MTRSPCRWTLPRLDGGTRTVRAEFTVRSCRSEDEQSWRVGGTLEPYAPEDGRALIEHCHVLSSRARLTESGRLEPGVAIDHEAVGTAQPVRRVGDL